MGLLKSIFGSKPDVPAMQRTDLGDSQKKAIANNQSALPAAEELVGQANLFSRGQIDQMLKSVIPNMDEMAASTNKNIASWLKGEIPDDVASAVTRRAAAKSLGTGTAGSGMSHDLVARDLGLTSLDLMSKGLSAEESWLSTVNKLYSPGMMNLSSMFITPQQQYTADNEQNKQQFERQWMENQISAQADPITVGLTKMGISGASALLGGIGGVGGMGVAALGLSGIGKSIGGGGGFFDFGGGSADGWGSADWMNMGDESSGKSIPG